MGEPKEGATFVGLDLSLTTDLTVEIDASPCPKCGAWVADPGEFGVLRHEACGYCAHPARDLVDGAWVCGICGDAQKAAARG